MLQLTKDMADGGKNLRTFDGIPWVWCELANFGGNTGPVSYTHLDVYKRQGWKGNVIPQQIHAVDIRKTVTSVPSSIRMLGVGRWQVDFLILQARVDKIQAGIVHGKG